MQYEELGGGTSSAAKVALAGVVGLLIVGLILLGVAMVGERNQPPSAPAEPKMRSSKAKV